MNVIYFINERITLEGLSKEDSVCLQKQHLLKYIQINNLNIVKPNIYQTNNYYTIQHALLYDLDKFEIPKVDYLLYYSKEVMEDFVYIYPDYWFLLKNHFNFVISLKNLDSFGDNSSSLIS
ncbi:hypothetical protein M3612_25040 [Niallia taxi]|uniref:hypothetical protein n=1 Tax=Niallia taxi TaxID=2499688 RepID=UPI00203F7D1B|nr:hypothetical protein [Niallia taxi]MCM3217739.1 hypothetical protein [Niallia taxi]